MIVFLTLLKEKETKIKNLGSKLNEMEIDTEKQRAKNRNSRIKSARTLSTSKAVFSFILIKIDESK